MSEFSRGNEFEKEIQGETKKTKEEEREEKLPPELRGIPLAPVHFETEVGKTRNFEKVVLGHLDLDTLSCYCMAREMGMIDENTEIKISHRASAENVTSKDTLTVEAQQDTATSMEELENLRKILKQQSFSTIEVDKKIKALNRTKTNPEQFNAKQGNITHTGEQKFTAAAQLFALTGRKKEYENIAQRVQQSEETRTLRKKKKREGRGFNQIMDQIIKKHTPKKGRRSPEETQKILDEIYNVFKYVQKTGLEFTDNIPLDVPVSKRSEDLNLFDQSKNLFHDYLEGMKAETEKKREELKDLKLVDSKETPTGLRITFFDGRESKIAGVFGKINTLQDKEGNNFSDVTVLQGPDPQEGRHQVKIALHKSLEGQIDLGLLAMILNSKKVLEGDIPLEKGIEEFGGHSNKFIGTPKREGTSIDPKEIFDVVTEYFSEERYSEKELLQFAESQDFKGARVVFLPGTGDKGIPEKALQFVDVESTSLSPELYYAGSYGEKLRTVRESQIDLENNRIMSDQELVEKYFENNQVDKALKVALTLPKEDSFKILSKPSFQNHLFQELVNNPEFAKKIYCPEKNSYFDLPANKYPDWVKNEEDKADYRFIDESSASTYVDKYVLAEQEMNAVRDYKKFAEEMKKILVSPQIREAFSQGEIRGNILESITALATASSFQFFSRDYPDPSYGKIFINDSVRQEIQEFIANELSSAEISYILTLLEEREALLKQDNLKDFSPKKNELIERISKRKDYQETRLRRPYPKVESEFSPTQDTRKVFTLEIGRHSDVKGEIEKMLELDQGEEKVDVQKMRYIGNTSKPPKVVK